MPFPRERVHKALLSKGFSIASKRKDHNYFYYQNQGKNTSVFTKTSTGTDYKTISDDLVSKMAKQIKLSSPQFKKFIDCRLSGEEYRKILVDLGIIKDDEVGQNVQSKVLSQSDLVDYSEFIETHFLWNVFEDGKPKFFLLPNNVYELDWREEIECCSIDDKGIEEIKISATELGISQ